MKTPATVLAIFCLTLSIQPADAQSLADSATPVDQIKLLPGFKAELLYSVPNKQQGSWVSLTVDDKGRLISSDQYGKLYRITPPAIGSGEPAQVEQLKVDMGMAHGLLYAFDSLYTMVNGRGKLKSGFYRLRDTNGDDQFDDVKLLREIPGRGEHGPHAIVLSPDGGSLYVCAGNHTDLPDVEKSLVPRNWQEDLLLPRMVDAGGHAVAQRAPGGWIARTDPDGKLFELVANGFRNEYDIAFNAEGELFTYDADMEWDVGTPWYRPTRVNHVTSGAEFGWRTGTGKWPAYYPDSLPAVVNIGPGSPTGIVFGTEANFPTKYRKALFICDWSYGVLYAVHMTPQGASYTGEAERFAAAAPLPLTDIVINPKDGAMYFTIGGRGTQSGLYRITYTGKESTAAPSVVENEAADLRKLRRRLESLHFSDQYHAIEAAWPYLSHDDRHIRFAARIAIEHQPVDRWRERALAERNPSAAIHALIALARNDGRDVQPALLGALQEIKFDDLDMSQKLDLTRAISLALSRFGPPSEEERAKLVLKLNPLFPSDDSRFNRELLQLLVYLEAPGIAHKAVAQLEKAPTQEQQLSYALALRTLESGWSLKDRKKYFAWFNKAAAHRGGHSFGGFLRNIRSEAIANLDGETKEALKDVLAAAPKPVDPEVALKSRPVVKDWTVEELLPIVESGLKGRDFEQGRKMFSVGACFKCHRFAGQGGIVGPDLTGVGRRFNAKDMLTAIIEPSKVVSDQFRSTKFQLVDGRVINGRVVNLNRDQLRVMTDMYNPGKLTAVKRQDIEEMAESTVSMMPEDLLNTFSKEEILDLLAYLRSGGNPEHEVFE